jgi:hypothetical protein
VLSRLSFLRVLVVVAVVAVAAPVAACGGSDTDNYKKDVTAAVNKLKADTDAVNRKVQAQTTPEGKIAAFSELRGKIAEAADTLAGLKPPDDAKAEHDRLVAELRGLDDNLKALEDAARAKDQAGAQAALASLTTELNATQQTANQLEQKVK